MTQNVFGVGIDLVELDDLERTIARRGDRFLARVFCEREIAYCKGKHRPVAHFAARFAAKEAAFKALGTGWAQGVGWHDVEIVLERWGDRPSLELRGEFARRMEKHRVGGAHVSLTHAKHYASAVVLLYGEGA